MRVTGAMTFDKYWNDPRFQVKKPNLRGSKKQAFGDNIYSRDANEKKWCQANSHHSFPDGGPNESNVRADTSANRVLFSDDYIYWGGSGPQIPAKFLNYGPDHISLLVVRNHKNTFPQSFVEQFVAWIRSRAESGYLGEPLDWCRTP